MNSYEPFPRQTFLKRTIFMRTPPPCSRTKTIEVWHLFCVDFSDTQLPNLGYEFFVKSAKRRPLKGDNPLGWYQPTVFNSMYPSTKQKSFQPADCMVWLWRIQYFLIFYFRSPQPIGISRTIPLLSHKHEFIIARHKTSSAAFLCPAWVFWRCFSIFIANSLFIVFSFVIFFCSGMWI